MLEPTTKWFSGYTSSKDELKSRYKELVKKYHPDIVGHDTEEIREINTEYDKLYDIILNGGVIPTFSNTKPSATPLVAYRIYLFIRNRYEENLEKLRKDIKTNSDFGKYVYTMRNEDYTGWLFGRYIETKTVYVENPPANMRSGFHVCEVSEKPVYVNDFGGKVCVDVARIIEGKTFESASLEDMYNLITSGASPWSIYAPDRDGFRLGFYRHSYNHRIIKYVKDSIYNKPGLHEMVYTATSKNYGDIVYTHNTNLSSRNVSCVTVFFKMDGIIYQTNVVKKQLGPLDNVQEYTPEDIVMLHKFGYNSEDLFSDADFDLPDVCVRLGFSRDDIVRDWPLDPALSRYVRLGVITVYRHRYQMFGHFNGMALYAAIVCNKIDLEDFDLCQEQFNDWYNDCLAKFKRDVKRGRIQL